jgi:predicted nucleotidyltransferase
MLTQHTAIDIANEFVLAILAKGFPLKKAILFGSYVRNEQHKLSDIDMALVADEFIGVGYFDMLHFIDVKISSRKYTDIEPHTFSTAWFEQGDPFIDEIKRTGIELPLKEAPALRSKRATLAAKTSAT